MPVWKPLIIALAVSAGCAALQVAHPPLSTYLHNKTFDLMVSSLERHPPSNRVSVVDIDEFSLTKIGPWPWPRTILAQLIRKLDEAGSAVIALDMVFPEPGRNSASDQTLATALAQSRSVIGYDFIFDGSRQRAGSCKVPPAPLVAADVLSFSQSSLLLPTASAMVCDIPVLESGVAQAGFLNSFRDRDGVVRRAPLLIAFRDAIFPSLALAAISTAMPPIILRKESQTPASILWDNKPVPVGEDGNLLLRYRGPSQSLPHQSAAQILKGSFDVSSLANRIVVIGSSANEVGGGLSTPFDPEFSSVEIQATAIDNLIARDYFYRPKWSPLFELASIFAAAFFSIWCWLRLPTSLSVCSILGAAALLWAACQSILAFHGAFLSPIPGITACLGTLAVCAAHVVFSEGRANLRSQEELAIANRFITGALGAMTTVRDIETGQHVVRIQGYLRSLCQVVAEKPRYRNYLKPEMIELLVQLAPIHDIGKVGVPDYILRKPGSLTAEEFELMKSHVTLGKRILEEAREQSRLRDEVFYETAKDIVYSHHERWDGSGYPLGLRGDSIPIPGRLLAMADVYDALISKRHYKAEIRHAEAVEHIRAGSGTQFDPEIVEAFLQVHDDWRRMAEAHRDEPGIAASTTI